ncbi:MAG: DMT family transporter [Rhodospirillales bacterium]|nr:DMT family transporter [Rhodospirillales bacterium]
MNKVLLAKFLAAFSALSAGFAIVATRLIIAETEPVTLAFLRFSIGAVCLIPFLIVGFRRNPIVRADWLPVLLLGITLFGIFTWLFSSSLKYTTAAHGAVGLASLPIVTLILAWLFGREQMSRIKIFSVVLAFLGVTVAVSDSLFAEAAGKDLLLGDILMLLATLAVAVYTVFAKPYIARYGPFFFTALAMVVGVTSLAFVVGYNGGLSAWPQFSPLGWWLLIFLGVIGGAIQFTAYIWALRWIPPSQAGIALTLTPISAFIIAWPALGEPITIEAVIGLALVLTAIFLINRTPPEGRIKIEPG